jgi:hypothetical protein
MTALSNEIEPESDDQQEVKRDKFLEFCQRTPLCMSDIRLKVNKQSHACFIAQSSIMLHLIIFFECFMKLRLNLGI